MTITSYSAVRRRESFLPADEETDAQILDRFIDAGDEAAFAEIVRRHGPMVLGVCRRIVQNPHDAEDCFQAAFLVLVRKADSIVPRSMVGNWLYGVAYRTALEARKMSAKRRNRERKVPFLPFIEPNADRWEELRPLLDQEVSRLPDDFRAVIVLCDLEGKTRAEVARELGVPEGTVASRLSRARALLAKRLSRHALSMSTTGLAALLAQSPTEAEVPPCLAESTIEAAGRLLAGDGTSGIVSNRARDLVDTVASAMGAGKIKVAIAGVLALVLVALGISAFLPSARADKKPNDEKIEQRQVVAEPVEGLIDAVSDTSVTIVYDDGKGALIAKKYGLDGKTEVLIDGKKGSPGDLKKKMKVTLLALPHKRTSTVLAAGSQVKGVIKAVDPDRQTVVVGNQALRVREQASILINGKASRMAELKTGMPITLQLAADPSTEAVVAVTADALGRE